MPAVYLPRFSSPLVSRTLPGMNSAALTKEQLRQLAGAADRARLFYARLVRRMEAQGFPLNDPLYRLAVETRNQTERLWIDLHYRYCGVNRDP